MVSHGGLFHAPVASQALRLRRPRSGGGDRLKPELQTLTAKNFFPCGISAEADIERIRRLAD